MKLRAWLERHREIGLFVLVAFVVRLVYGLALHPPASFLWSDMAGYVARADEMLTNPWARDPVATFFPWGTHALVAAITWPFGRHGGAAIAVCFAALGAATVGWSLAVARRLLGDEHRLVARALGVLLVFHVPWIELGGFVLSETPFACALAASAFYGLRLVDEASPRDALALGGALAVAVPLRPQILASVVLLSALWLARRRALPAIGPTIALRVVGPIVAVLAISSVRFAYHTAELGLVSSNTALNVAFGRCHAAKIVSRGAGHFQFASFERLRLFEEERGAPPLLDLDPAMGPVIEIDEPLWRPPPLFALARACVAKTGLLKQAKYAVTHVFLLWAYGPPWPTSGRAAEAWAIAQALWVPGALAALLWCALGRRDREAMLAIHVVALVVTAMVFAGDPRLRVPYDGLLMILAASSYVRGFSSPRARAPAQPPPPPRAPP